MLCAHHITPLQKKGQKEHGDFSIPGFFKEFKPIRRGVLNPVIRHKFSSTGTGAMDF